MAENLGAELATAATQQISCGRKVKLKEGMNCKYNLATIKCVDPTMTRRKGRRCILPTTVCDLYSRWKEKPHLSNDYKETRIELPEIANMQRKRIPNKVFYFSDNQAASVYDFGSQVHSFFQFCAH